MTEIVGEYVKSLPPSWRVVTLGEISLRPGEYGSVSPAIPWSSGLPRYVRITDIDTDGTLSRESIAGISWESGRPYLLAQGDICFARSGATVGKTYLYDPKDGDCAFAGYVIRFAVDPDQALSKYVSAWTRGATYWRWVSSVLRQGAQPNINAKEYASHKMLLPPLDQQRKIVSALDSADEAIRSVERIIVKLEGLRQEFLAGTLGAGLEGRVAGWQPARLGELLDGRPKNGYSPMPGNAFSGVYMLSLGCLTMNGFSASQLKFAPDGDPVVLRALLTDGDLLISRANTRELVGMAGRYVDVGYPCIYPDLMMRLRAGREVRAEFLELILRSDYCRRQIQARASGTSESMVKISSGTIMNLAVRVPSLDEQRRIVNEHEALAATIDGARSEKVKLCAIRWALANDLLAGRKVLTQI